ncbi:ATP-binding protein [Streptomyces albidoflavus]|uniref:ATP-binding protein n=1 Tax=Streptomyces albidoflavus TaxID=1886 RepID=UPI0033CAE60C
MHSPLGPPPQLGPLRHIEYKRIYASDLASIPRVRADFLKAAAAAALDEDITETAELLLSELAANAVRHAHDPRPKPRIHVTVRVHGMRSRSLSLEVYDRDRDRLPVFPTASGAPDLLGDLADGAAETGRGLAMIAALAAKVGVDAFAELVGKVVWCRIPLPRPNVAPGASRPALPG